MYLILKWENIDWEFSNETILHTKYTEKTKVKLKPYNGQTHLKIGKVR